MMSKKFFLPLLVCLALPVVAAPTAKSDEYPDFYDGTSTKGISFVQSIRVLAPAIGSNVKGNVTVVYEAPGMSRVVARCWRAAQAGDGDGWGRDVVLAEQTLGKDARGEFVFPADKFPHGPTTIRLQAQDKSGRQDLFELQLYNLGGVVWQEGLPKADPPAAKGLKLVFADDFAGPLSVSPDGRGARYAAHKTGGGDFSGWPFADPEGDCLPFATQDTYLRIHASKPYGTQGRTGILSSIRADGSGVAVPVPAYFECRLMCHSGPGSWGAFWTLTKNTIGMSDKDPDFARVKAQGCDELDVIECYGGYGRGTPNAGGRYGVTSHYWGRKEKAPHTTVDTKDVGGHASWSWTFHNYGLLIGELDTVYYFDDVEVLRHPTSATTKAQLTWFLINYAIGGISGWPIDLARYGNASDMWVDWVRVYCGKPLPADFGRTPVVGVPGSIGVNFSDLRDEDRRLRAWDMAGMGATAQRGWVNVPCEPGAETGLANDAGAATSLGVTVGEGAACERCEDWGFHGGDRRLHRAGVRGGAVRLAQIPFKKYDLVLHLGAGVNGWRGNVQVKDGHGRTLGAQGLNFGWNGGAYVETKRAADAVAGDGSENTVVLRGLTADALEISLRHLDGKGTPALAGLQLVPQT